MAKEKNPTVYFGVEQKKKFYLPNTGKEQWIEHKKLNEAQREKYEDASNNNFVMDTNTNKVEVSMAMGADRRALFDAAVVGYKVLAMENGEATEKTGFDQGTWDKIRGDMPSDISQGLMEDIREFNPWLKPAEDGKKN